MGEMTKDKLPESVRLVVFKESEQLDGLHANIEGYDFNKGVNYHELFKSMAFTGFQASNLGDAIQLVNEMALLENGSKVLENIDKCNSTKLLILQLYSEESIKTPSGIVVYSTTLSILLDEWREGKGRKQHEGVSLQNYLKDYQGFPWVKQENTWLRQIITPQAGKVPSHGIVWLKWTATVKSWRVMLDWRLSDENLMEDCSEEERNMAYRESVDVVVTTAGGVEEDLMKCLAPTYKGDFSLPGAVLRSKGLTALNVLWTPSKVIARLGKEIDDESSYLYWAYKNNIPVFCPGLTDGSLGDMLYFHSYKKEPGLVIDIVQDIRAMNNEAVHAGQRKTGMIILGGGLPKHHICNASMMRNGADFAIFINTAQEFDGSDSGARPDEAVHCDATIAFPLLVAETFAAKAKRSSQTSS
ncbi:hypothetical protein BUALT_Bualt06G0026200 [Buddleja alternifolia]|uniref:Deoxyhypusine synthase n=1 Tax=Buddleja alternifolia TaxID=168488 RepID=A0AAV6XGP1_9LAMI|nr:hypothetical protein BUALT_Bualt06G0026200 [Buddleja alternifolia]